MLSFIPLEYYAEVYFQFILIICLFTLLHSYLLEGDEALVYNYNTVLGSILLTSLVLYIGLRPVSGVYFADMATYADTFLRLQNGDDIFREGGDIGFEYFLRFSAAFLTLDSFFLVCAFIYIYPLFLASKNWFPKYYFFLFVLFIGSFSFYAYGVNGMRNGMATSLFILALSYASTSKIKMILFFLLSLLFHKSMMLPMLAYGITYFVKDTRKYYYFWFLSILLSITMGSVWINVFANLGFGGDRLSGYLTAANTQKFSSTGFRYDFLLYSAVPLVLAYIYNFKKSFNDIEYNRILHTYMIANAFWIMIIRANFSNRFAYLSWFLMAIVVGYPLLKELIFKKQFKRLGITIILYYGFTYGMFYYYQFR